MMMSFLLQEGPLSILSSHDELNQSFLIVLEAHIYNLRVHRLYLKFLYFLLNCSLY